MKAPDAADLQALQVPREWTLSATETQCKPQRIRKGGNGDDPPQGRQLNGFAEHAANKKEQRVDARPRSTGRPPAECRAASVADCDDQVLGEPSDPHVITTQECNMSADKELCGDTKDGSRGGEATPLHATQPSAPSGAEAQVAQPTCIKAGAQNPQAGTSTQSGMKHLGDGHTETRLSRMAHQSQDQRRRLGTAELRGRRQNAA
jgi:hypothetical protein